MKQESLRRLIRRTAAELTKELRRLAAGIFALPSHSPPSTGHRPPSTSRNPFPTPQARDLFKAPWPPGSDWRFIVHGGRRWFQLRPGAHLTPQQYNHFRQEVLYRATWQSAHPCPN